MRFLVISKSKHLAPPEMTLGLLDAMVAWTNKYKQNGKIEAVWATAGVPGGGGILNVNSLEEIDAILAEYPFGPFSDTEVIPIVDLVESLQRAKQAAQAMMPGGGGS